MTGTRTSSSRAVIPKDRKSTRLNSSHLVISYAVFCLKKNEVGKKRAARTDGDFPYPIHDEVADRKVTRRSPITVSVVRILTAEGSAVIAIRIVGLHP